MELQSCILVVVFTPLLLLWLAKNHKQKNKAKSTIHRVRHPPGPWKLPLIGNLHQLAAAGSLPHHALRKLAQKCGPLMHLQLGEISAVVVSSPNMAKEIMKTHDLSFVHRPQLLAAKIMVYGTADIAFAPYGDYWRQMRKICTLELMSVKRVQSFSHIREQEVTQLIESIQSSCAAGSPIDFTSKVFSLASAFVSRAAFGSKCKDGDEFISLLNKVSKMAGGFDLADLFPSDKFKPIHHITGMKAKLEKLHTRLENILEDIINENREKQMGAEEGKSKPENLVQVLLRIQQSGDLQVPITDHNIKAVIWDIFSGGADTSATAIEWGMSELIKNPRVKEKAQDEIRQAFSGMETFHETDVEKLGYLKSVVKETLRLHPPAPLLLPRECREACTIDGHDIPIKTKVIVNAWAVGRDPEHWYDAERFIPERFHFHGSSIDFRGTNFEYIPFGAGRRICPGISFGLASIEFALAKLLYHFDWELPNTTKPQDLDMTEAFGVVVGRKNHLYLIATPYNPSLQDNVN